METILEFVSCLLFRYSAEVRIQKHSNSEHLNYRKQKLDKRGLGRKWING